VFIHIFKVNAMVYTLYIMVPSQQRLYQTPTHILNFVLLYIYKEHLHQFFIFRSLIWIFHVV
jgi:hypothetical protein